MKRKSSYIRHPDWLHRNKFLGDLGCKFCRDDEKRTRERCSEIETSGLDFLNELQQRLIDNGFL